MLVVGLAVNEGLEAALDVDGGGGRVDEFGGDEGERGGEPGGGEGESQTEGDCSDEMFAARFGRGWLGKWVGGGGHLTE